MTEAADTSSLTPEQRQAWLDDTPWLGDLLPLDPPPGWSYWPLDEARASRDSDADQARESFPLGTMYRSDAMFDLTLATTIMRLPLLHAPAVRTADGDEVSGLVSVDATTPGVVYCSPCPELVSAVWSRVPATWDDIVAQFAEWDVPVAPRVGEYPVVRRAFAAYLHENLVPSVYSGELTYATPIELERNWTMHPAMQLLSWGSAHHDPLPLDEEPANQLEKIAIMRTLLEQDADRGHAVSRRTSFTQSLVRFEFDALGCMAWELRYVPTAYRTTNRTLATALSRPDLPDDLPIDVLAVIGDWAFRSPESVRAKLDEARAEDSPAAAIYWVGALTAIGRADGWVREDLRREYLRWPDDIDVRVRVVNLCLRHNFRALFEDIAALEPDDDLRAFMVSKLQGDGWGPAPLDEDGEPYDLYQNISDEDEDE